MEIENALQQLPNTHFLMEQQINRPYKKKNNITLKNAGSLLIPITNGFRKYQKIRW